VEVLKEPKRIQLPREVWMGPRVFGQLGDICRRLCPGKRGLVISDKNTFRVAGAAAERMLEDAGFEVSHFIIKEADVETAERIRPIAEKNSDFMVGVGGGRSIDIAKVVSFWIGRPFVSVPTAASHDGIASSRASLRGTKVPTSIDTHSPIGIVADTLIIKRAPHRLLAAGCGDAIANLTAVNDWELAHRLKGEPYSEYAAALSRVSAKLVMDNARVIRKHTEESVRKVVKSLISSGVAMGIAGSSRPASGAEHMFSHALDLIAPRPALHGEQCGVGAIMMAYLQGEDWMAIRDALKTIGAPTTAKELGISPKHLIKALTIAHRIRPERYTILKDGLSAKKAESLARATGVI